MFPTHKTVRFAHDLYIPCSGYVFFYFISLLLFLLCLAGLDWFLLHHDSLLYWCPCLLPHIIHKFAALNDIFPDNVILILQCNILHCHCLHYCAIWVVCFVCVCQCMVFMGTYFVYLVDTLSMMCVLSFMMIWSCKSCSAMIGVTLICLLFLVITCPVIVTLILYYLLLW